MIPRHHINFSKQERRIIEKALLGLAGRTIDYASRLESSFARYIGTQHAVSVSSARRGLFAILKALRLDPGEEVILPAYSFWAVVETVKALQLNPVFARIDPDTYNIDCTSIKEKITPRTRAVIVEHIFGQPADLDPLVHIARENNLVLIEDCAQACGSEYHNKKVGSFGDINYFSFANGKNLTTLGGGMVTTNDCVLYERVCSQLEAHGGKIKNQPVYKPLLSGLLQHLITSCPAVYLPLGIASGLFPKAAFQEKPSSITPQEAEASLFRMDNVLAHIGLVQLSRLGRLNKQRIENTNILINGLSGLAGIKLQQRLANTINVCSCFSLETGQGKRDKLARQLLFQGVDCRKDWMNHYLEGKLKNLPERILYIPNYPALKKEQLLSIVARVKEVISRL